MVSLTNIYTLSEFQQSAKAFLVKLKETKAPICLTVDGEATVVVQDAESYQQLLEKVQLLESIKSVQKSIKEFERGEGISLTEAFQQFEEKHGLPD